VQQLTLGKHAMGLALLQTERLNDPNGRATIQLPVRFKTPPKIQSFEKLEIFEICEILGQ
jgi:hypothetical protein